MDSVNKTLYIPLYGKALVSKKGVILNDKKAEEIWEKEKFKLKGKSKSKWLAYYLGMRSAVFDSWLTNKLKECPNSLVLHLGCGMDSRALRVQCDAVWCDIDLNSVIEERKKYFSETNNYRMLSADIGNADFITELPQAESVVVILEGVSMYIPNENLIRTLNKLCEKYSNLSVLIDCYTPFAVKMSKIKNPINEMGKIKVYGIENHNVLENGELKFVSEREMTPIGLINQLKGFEKFIFKNLYAGKVAKKLYNLYEYEK